MSVAYLDRNPRNAVTCVGSSVAVQEIDCTGLEIYPHVVDVRREQKVSLTFALLSVVQSGLCLLSCLDC